MTYDDLFLRFYPELCVYAESFISNRFIAEDLVQNVFVNIWIKKDELIFEKALSSYLYRSVHNACIQHLRHIQIINRNDAHIRAKLEEGELIDVSIINLSLDPAERSEILSLYEKAIDLLSGTTKEIFLMSREKGMKNQEIAKRLNLSVKSIEYHISRALNIFRKVFKDYLTVLLVLFFRQ
ncbi:MAG: RNA polymerase sigma-70 factor [Dysgonamonadaceae bacterium]|jgi:RNA polymerase sigma-70 factor (ECF subfamily)|nr:RNA polymerase sigma-70 factor [Dysgonamonadaceae bacterium]